MFNIYQGDKEAASRDREDGRRFKKLMQGFEQGMANTGNLLGTLCSLEDSHTCFPP